MSRLRKVLYPDVFNGKYILTHWDFEDDLKGILERSGRKADFWGKYKQRLRFLDERRTRCIQRSNWFEDLKHTEELYSMLFDRNEKNIRILFCFITYQKVQHALLLYAFEEKDNKKGSRYSYKKGIPVALKRLEEVMQDG
jgi:hypothetical protein